MNETKKTFLYEAVDAVKQLNEVEGFNPSEHMRTLVDEDGTTSLYLDVKFRELWFRLKHPNGKILNKAISLTEQYAVIESRLYLDKNDDYDNCIANGIAKRYLAEEDNKYGSKYVETAETAALGRALDHAGFGSQFCDANTQKDITPVDSGVPTILNNEPTDNNHTTPKQEVNTIDKSQPVEEILKVLTIKEAKETIIEVGRNKGMTLGNLAINNPGDLEWYVNTYQGKDNLLKAAAKKLIETAYCS